jgi:hypothetical protein
MHSPAITTQRQVREQAGLALIWQPVAGAVRYGFIVGIADAPVPSLDAIMRREIREFALLGIPPRFTGAIDVGSPVGEERQYGLVAYRGDGSLVAVPNLEFFPARSAPRDRDYYLVSPPALERLTRQVDRPRQDPAPLAPLAGVEQPDAHAAPDTEPSWPATWLSTPGAVHGADQAAPQTVDQWDEGTPDLEPHPIPDLQSPSADRDSWEDQQAPAHEPYAGDAESVSDMSGSVDRDTAGEDATPSAAPTFAAAPSIAESPREEPPPSAASMAPIPYLPEDSVVPGVPEGEEETLFQTVLPAQQDVAPEEEQDWAPEQDQADTHSLSPAGVQPAHRTEAEPEGYAAAEDELPAGYQLALPLLGEISTAPTADLPRTAMGEEATAPANDPPFGVPAPAPRGVEIDHQPGPTSTPESTGFNATPANTAPLAAPDSVAALLDEAERCLLPPHADHAEAARLLEQAALFAPADPRLAALRRRPQDAERDDKEDMSGVLLEAERSMGAGDYWGAVDNYEQACARQPDNRQLQERLARARILARWSARLAGAGSDPLRLRQLGDEYATIAPDLAVQAYAAAFTRQPTIEVLRAWLLALVRDNRLAALGPAARDAVQTLRQAGAIRADDAQDAALDALDRADIEGSGVEDALSDLVDVLGAASLDSPDERNARPTA